MGNTYDVDEKKLEEENTSELPIKIEGSKSLNMRIAFLFIMDALVISIAKFAAVFIRFEFSFKEIVPEFFEGFKQELIPAVMLTLVIFALFKLYRSIWEYASVDECLRIFAASLVATALNVMLNKILGIHMFRSYYVISFMLIYFGVFATRFSYRFFRWIQTEAEEVSKSSVNTMIIGAGDSGAMMVREIGLRPETGRRVRCLIDDDKSKKGKYIKGAQVVGGRDQIIDAVGKYAIDEIILAMPSSSPKNISEILNICSETSCKLRILPNMEQIIKGGSINLSELREVKVDDLLGRDPIKVDLQEIMGYVQGKVVVVTGGGGSIGSELCRQLVDHEPKMLIVIDIYENNAYDLQQELRRTHPDANVEFLIASVRDERRIRNIFEQYKPEIVYHAAAHKHVPLMEESPNEAIKNNVFGTFKTAKVAAECGVKRFVLISTDKAVNPTNIMGASKRICEMVIQQMDKMYNGTEFVAVRFGNVLASNGSVVKLFEKQIAEGGPVTVTHRDIVRYFMTIPEAVSLVLQAGAYAKGGEIFVLDMGAPVKIDSLARRMIRLSGYIPDIDIKVEYIGLRPGEKLYEEMLMAEEGMKETPNKLIHIGNPIEMDYELFNSQMTELDTACNNNAENIAHLVSKVVPTYTISDELK